MAKDEVKLVFSRRNTKLVEMSGFKSVEPFAIQLNELMDWFKEYTVDSIELSIEASVKSGGVVNLFVSAEGKGGMKVTLKPKKK
jgi:hypothetical protein